MTIKESKAREVGAAFNRFLTPFAVAVVAMAAIAHGLTLATKAALSIAVFTGLGNVAMARLAQQRPETLSWLRNFRIGFNYSFNIALAWILWPYWKPVWLLYLLSIAAVASFEDRKATMATAAMFSLILGSVHFARGDGSWAEGCETLIYLAALWSTGLLINRVVHGRPQAAAQPVVP